MNFLPEEDQEYLRNKGINHVLLTEIGPDGKELTRGVLFPAFEVPSNLRTQNEGALVGCERCELLITIPAGYATTKLDSFYTIPHLRRQDGTDPQAAGVVQILLGRSWQFWSRHLEDKDWRVGVDGLGTYLSYVRNELRSV